MEVKLTHCLWVDPDSGSAHIDEIKNCPERIPFGGYVPSVIGTQKEMEKLCKKVQKKPFLINKLLKTIPA